MSSTYEIWLCDDYGRRQYLFRSLAFFSYSRSTQGLGTIQLGLPYEFYLKENIPSFHPDWRLDVWRSPQTGIPARREGSFLLRKFNIYERSTDNMLMFEMFGRSPLDLLRRQHYKGTDAFTDEIDNIMKTVVSAQFVTNQTAYSTSPNTVAGSVYTSTGEFVVDEDSSDGPIVTDNFYLKNILDICSDLKKASFTLNAILSTNKKIYFDVIEDEGAGLSGGFGYRFRTYPDIRGRNRTGGIVYSTQNGNLSVPSYYEDYLDQYTSVFKHNSAQAWASQNAQSEDQYLSRWNYIENASTTSEEVAAVALNNVYSVLQGGEKQEVFNADFLNSPGSDTQPRSLYGVDWDLGDLLPVKFAGKILNTEVAIVWVGINDLGREKITGKTTVGI